MAKRSLMRTLFFDAAHAVLSITYRSLLAAQGILYELEFNRRAPTEDEAIREIEKALSEVTFAQPVKLHMVSAHDAKAQFMVMKKKGELN